MESVSGERSLKEQVDLYSSKYGEFQVKKNHHIKKIVHKISNRPIILGINEKES